MDPTKDLTLDGTRYQLGRLSARNGSWVVGQFLMKGLLLQIEHPEKEVDEKDLALIFAATLPALPEDVFTSVQAKCLAACKRYAAVGDADIPMPVLRQDGSWNAVAEPSLPEVMALTVASLVFNLHPFFEPGALKTLLTVFPNVSLIGAPGSTDTSSVQ